MDETLFQRLSTLAGTANPDLELHQALTDRICKHSSAIIALVTEKPSADKGVLMVYYKRHRFEWKDLQELQTAFPLMRELIVDCEVGPECGVGTDDIQFSEFLESAKTLKLFVLMTDSHPPQNISDLAAIWESTLGVNNFHALYYRTRLIVVMNQPNLEISAL